MTKAQDLEMKMHQATVHTEVKYFLESNLLCKVFYTKFTNYYRIFQAFQHKSHNSKFLKNLVKLYWYFNANITSNKAILDCAQLCCIMRLIVAEGFSPSFIIWELEPLAAPKHSPFINVLQLETTHSAYHRGIERSEGCLNNNIPIFLKLFL